MVIGIDAHKRTHSSAYRRSWMAHARDADRTYGKSDPIDTLTVARAALPSNATRGSVRPNA
ncbi:hypothetical protein OG777_17090 [Micromonospora peucetia]|uniref:hypothetical protein n=1 Tax=Micromonospora peucetia TaxID=47871 RepID=UPI000B894332|nr:hypothetical protein [Micromonospora peucetia]MCX4388639.1 hypothetical protein [Micromonospora peucetia]